MSVDHWLSALRPSTAKTSVSNLNRFLAWLKLNGGKFSTFTPDELIAYQKQAVGDARFEILDTVENFIRSRQGTYFYLRTQLKDIRSFFQHNRADLPRDIQFRVNGTTEPKQGSLTPDEIRKVILSHNPLYQAVFLCMFEGALGEAEFEFWNSHGLSKLVTDLEDNPSIIRIDLPGRKSSRNRFPYYSLIGGDALKALKIWMELRPEVLSKSHKHREIDNPLDGSTSIFIDQFGNGVSKDAIYQQWMIHLKKLGIVKTGWEGKNLHELRDSFRSLWEKSPSEKSCGEFLMGHQIDPLGYNKAHRDEAWVKNEYKKALPWLNILSSTRPYGLVSESIIEEQQIQILELKEYVETHTITPQVEALLKELGEKILKKDK